ncbi:MAG: invasion protein IalB [Motiliproteus sp.]|jgi:invasion protein IalB
MKRLFIIISLSFLLPCATAFAAANSGDKFGDWLFECQALAANKTNCVLSQTLINNESKQRVLRLAISNSKDGTGLRLVSIMPLGIYLPAGVTVNTERGVAIPMMLKSCTQQGCIATSVLTAENIEAIQSEKELSVVFSVNKNTPVKLSISLKGTRAGLKEIK